MDSITHIALGACMGEAFAGKQLGRKALLWGALAQSIPDIDVISSLWENTSTNLLTHRSFTHSLLFCFIITPLFAHFAELWHRPHNISFTRWVLFFGGVVFIHIFIDAFNNYGVGWFEPFSRTRISFNSIYVADPFFTIWPIIACIALMYLNRKNKRRKRWWIMGLGLSGVYLMYCIFNKTVIDNEVKETLHKQQIAYTRYFTTPAPLQNWLWFVVAGNDKGYHVGFHSLFDQNKDIKFEYFPRNDSLLNSVKGEEEVQQLIRFSQQYYTVEKWNDTLVFNDLRFGQVIGWQNPRGKFAFHYYLKDNADNTLVVNRGRFEGGSWHTLGTLIERIKGK
ncbi:MAG TPA: metal-dependent hydrolase [Saprospiraceae bacterium]|nr:metal-dependent hydrolase [Saprospiraceae bacterium]